MSNHGLRAAIQSRLMFRKNSPNYLRGIIRGVAKGLGWITCAGQTRINVGFQTAALPLTEVALSDRSRRDDNSS
jgi:hypothetical protein